MRSLTHARRTSSSVLGETSPRRRVPIKFLTESRSNCSIKVRVFTSEHRMRGSLSRCSACEVFRIRNGYPSSQSSGHTCVLVCSVEKSIPTNLRLSRIIFALLPRRKKCTSIRESHRKLRKLRSFYISRSPTIRESVPDARFYSIYRLSGGRLRNPFVA